MFDKIVADIEAVVSDIQAGDWGKAITDVGTAVVDAGPIVAPFFAAKMQACPPAECDKVKKACDKLQAACDHQAAKKCADGSIFPGDGSVIKAILAFAAQLLVILGPILKPAA